jgi:two-component system sensor histidine kinase CpxA
MKSLFLRMFLWFCATNTLLIGAIVVGYQISNPDQILFTWPQVGRGAITSAGRVAVETFEHGGTPELTRYLESLSRDTGLNGNLFDSPDRTVSGDAPGLRVPEELTTYPVGQLMLRVRGRLAGIRLTGRSGRQYIFVTTVPRREASGFWSRTFLISFVLTGALFCYLLTRHITAPVVQLRTLTSRFAGGELRARITSPKILRRKDEIGGLARDFNQMASHIETLMKSQQRLVADVSHELRSPLTRLSLALGLVRRSKNEDAGVSLARMEREVERLNILIDQLLTLSRLESRSEPPPMQMFDLGALVQEIAADAEFEAAAMDRGVQLRECAACSIMGSRDLLRSAVENVVRNAVKYTRPEAPVQISLRRNSGNQAAIVVEDEGPGVPADALEHIFEPFYRVDEARDRQSGGAGLGLAITRQIVALHGGSVIAANRAAGGLELRIVLPVSN